MRTFAKIFFTAIVLFGSIFHFKAWGQFKIEAINSGHKDGACTEEVIIEKPDTAIHACEGYHLHDEDILNTMTATVLLKSPKMEIYVNKGTRLQVSSNGCDQNGCCLDLRKGQIYNKAKTGCNIKTGNGSMRNISTEYIVTYDSATSRTELVVFEGSVSMSGNGDTINVAADSVAYILGQGSPVFTQTLVSSAIKGQLAAWIDPLTSAPWYASPFFYVPVGVGVIVGGVEALLPKKNTTDLTITVQWRP